MRLHHLELLAANVVPLFTNKRNQSCSKSDMWIVPVSQCFAQSASSPLPRATALGIERFGWAVVACSATNRELIRLVSPPSGYTDAPIWLSATINAASGASAGITPCSALLMVCFRASVLCRKSVQWRVYLFPAMLPVQHRCQ